MTAEDMEKLNDLNDYDRSVILGLLDCQFTKYAAIHGQQAAEEHLDELLGDALSSSPSGEAVSIQERMMSEGFTCSLNEIIETQAATSYGAEE
jgi:hypothetical protein